MAVNLLWTFDVEISEDCGVLCRCVSPVKVTKSCNQRLFTADPLHFFHNLSSLSVSLIPECQCDVKGTLSGVGECEQVSISRLPPVTDTQLLVTHLRCLSYILLIICLSRKVDIVTVSLMHVDMHATPVRMDTSCCRKRCILAVKVRHPPYPNFYLHITLANTVYCVLWHTRQL